MVSDWLKTQKKPPRTNHIRAVLTTKFKKWPWFSANDDLIFQPNNNRTVKKVFQKPEQSKKYVFLAKLEKNTVNKIEENESENLNLLPKADYGEVKKKKEEQKRWQPHAKP